MSGDWSVFYVALRLSAMAKDQANVMAQIYYEAG